MREPFYGARLKIERARRHMNDLQHAAQLYGDTHPHIVTVETDAVTGDNLLRIDPADPLPDELLLILGDAIHNLRSALDHAWCMMVVTQGTWAKFPFRRTRTEFEAAVNGLKDNVSDEIKQCLLHSVQPYPGGRCELLLHLHDLDIEDKHRLLIAHREFTLITGMMV
jgi:hypothetical protein